MKPSPVMRRIFPLLAIFLIFPVCAQRGPDPKKTTVRFAAQILPPGVADVEMTTPEIRAEAFELPIHNLTEPLIPPARTFQLKAAGTETALATVILPADGLKFVILLVLGEKPGFTPIIIPADGPGFKADQVFTYNSSGKTILGKVGSTNFAIPPGASQVVKPAGAVDGRYYDVALGQRDESGDRVISTSRWPVSKNKRSYLFFYNDPELATVRFRAFSEFVGGTGE